MEQENDRKRKATVSPVEGSKVNRNRRKKKKATKKPISRQVSDISSSDEDRNRTPSGTVLKKKVKDIRTYLEMANKLKDIGLSRQQIGNQSGVNVNSSEIPALNMKTQEQKHEGAGRSSPVDSEVNTESANAVLHTCHDQETRDDSSKQQTSEGENFHSPNVNMSTENSGSESESVKSNASEETTFLKALSKILKTKNEEEMQTDEKDEEDESLENQHKSLESEMPSQKKIDCHMQKLEMELNGEENPKTLSLTAVMEMFSEIKKSQQRDKQEIMEAVKGIKTSCIQEAKKSVASELSKIEEFESELTYWKLKSETLSEVCNRMSIEIQDLTTRMDNMEFNGSKKKVVLSGLRLEGEGKKQTLEFLMDFLEFYLGEAIVVDDYFTLGNPEQLQTVLIFQNIETKRNVLRLKHLLKSYTNEQGRKVYINEYLPSAALEKRRKEGEIFNMYQQVGEPEAVTYIRGQIGVNNRPYSKLVTPPTPKELINISTEELERILQLRPKRSGKIIEENSEFMAYAADVGSIQEIKDLYVRTKLIKPEARHVVCAYTLSDESMEECYKHDYHDDGEPAAGRAILNVLKHHNIQNKAVFIARKYGGTKMGANRFTCYIQAACDALQVSVPEKRLVRRQEKESLADRNVSEQTKEQQEASNDEGKVQRMRHFLPPQKKQFYQHGYEESRQTRRGNTTHVRRGAYPPGIHKSPYHHSNARRPTASVCGTKPPTTQGYSRYNYYMSSKPREFNRKSFRPEYDSNQDFRGQGNDENADYGHYPTEYRFANPWNA